MGMTAHSLVIEKDFSHLATEVVNERSPDLPAQFPMRLDLGHASQLGGDKANPADGAIQELYVSTGGKSVKNVDEGDPKPSTLGSIATSPQDEDRETEWVAIDR